MGWALSRLEVDLARVTWTGWAHLSSGVGIATEWSRAVAARKACQAAKPLPSPIGDACTPHSSFQVPRPKAWRPARPARPTAAYCRVEEFGRASNLSAARTPAEMPRAAAAVCPRPPPGSRQRDQTPCRARYDPRDSRRLCCAARCAVLRSPGQGSCSSFDSCRLARSCWQGRSTTRHNAPWEPRSCLLHRACMPCPCEVTQMHSSPLLNTSPKRNIFKIIIKETFAAHEDDTMASPYITGRPVGRGALVEPKQLSS